MSIIKQYHKDTGVTYVFESEDYWDPEKKQARSRRRCIGKLDPATGEIVPTGNRGRKKKGEHSIPSAESEVDGNGTLLKARQEIESLKKQVKDLEKELEITSAKNARLSAALREIMAAAMAADPQD